MCRIELLQSLTDHVSTLICPLNPFDQGASFECTCTSITGLGKTQLTTVRYTQAYHVDTFSVLARRANVVSHARMQIVERVDLGMHRTLGSDAVCTGCNNVSSLARVHDNDVVMIQNRVS